MRKIEQQMVNAVKAKTNFSLTNTKVEFVRAYGISQVYLHGHHIGGYSHSKNEFIVNVETLFHWPTNTTKSRLRALGVNVTTKKGISYLDGKEV